MKLVDQWRALEETLPEGWEDVRLTLTSEQPADLPRAAQVLGSINVGRVGDTLVFRVASTAGPNGKQTAQRLFDRTHHGDRIKALVKAEKLESAGDIDRWRYSEIRLTGK